ncbi:cytokine receptor family member B16 [Xyrichtys novacula]|uniref:Cytokine receptor family member B16 n=1 Tax=Xyrichtys novacula TaxID=13765 RepID=A0AAV1GG93_XYRNO|nr:cytokine receptor family member B16 [Xyrichtys novacula]
MTLSLLVLTAMMTVLLDFRNSVWMLPSPSSVSMDSVNMRHVLKWLPLQASCDTAVLYSVQFQGEFELTFRNGSWLPAHECQLTPHTHCDLTFDLGSDSDYNLRVRAQCGSDLSDWSLSGPFNRRQTVLTVPEMTVTAVGDALQVMFDKLPVTVGVSVTVWKKGDELQADVFTVPSGQKVLHIAALQEDEVYCIRAHTTVNTELHSSSTDTQCVHITGPDAAWKAPTTVTATVIITAGVLFAVFWSIVHCRSDACQAYFRKEQLPRSLKSDWDIRIQVSSEEAELCEQIHVVQSDKLELEELKRGS